MAASKPDRLASRPISDQEFHACLTRLGPFETAPHLAIAVSGGADSMALCLLAHDWTNRHGGRITALTVDHGLRPESAAEAAHVTTWLTARGIAHRTLRWEGVKPQTGIQEEARHARYALMTEWCRTHQVLHLLLAHHLDDQAETVLMRVSRGSSVAGLAGMQAVSEWGEVRLLRPLLRVTKERLIAWLHDHNQPWLEDPGNASDTYTRNRIRRALLAHPDPDIGRRIAQTADEMAEARQILEHAVARALVSCCNIYPTGYATLSHAAMQAQDKAVFLRTLSRLIATVGGHHYPPRTDSLQRFWQDMRADGLQRNRTLGGCVFIPSQKKNEKDLIHVVREPRAIQNAITLAEKRKIVWDQRFMCQLQGGAPDLTYHVRALDNDGLTQLSILPTLPKPVLIALPSLWHLETLLIAPHIGFAREEAENVTFTADFRPPNPLARHAFFGTTSA